MLFQIQMSTMILFNKSQDITFDSKTKILYSSTKIYFSFLTGDGVIDFEEFKVLMLKKMKNTDAAEDITDIFHRLDIRHHGYFTARDLHSVIVGLGENFTVDEAEELVNDTKTEQPGRINYDGRLFISYKIEKN